MNKTLKIGGILLILIAGWVGVELALTLREARTAVVEVHSTTKRARELMNRNEKEVFAIISDARKILAEQKQSIKDTSENSKKVSDQALKSVEKLNAILEKVNNETIPKFNQTLETANTQLQNTGEETANTLAVTRKSLEATLAEATRTTAALHDVVADPAIKESLKNLETASREGAESVKEVKGAVTDVHEMTTDVKVAVKRVTKPANMTLRVLSWLWDKAMGAKVAF